MTINYNKDKERQHYIEINHLEDSYIDKNLLYQYNKVLPQRNYVGRTESGYKVFYEETQTSLKKRNYGKSDVVTSWNLLYSDGDKSEKVTKEFIENNGFYFYDGYSIGSLMYFLENNSKCLNALDNRKNCTINVTEEEFEMVQEFLKKVRGKK